MDVHDGLGRLDEHEACGLVRLPGGHFGGEVAPAGGAHKDVWTLDRRRVQQLFEVTDDLVDPPATLGSAAPSRAQAVVGARACLGTEIRDDRLPVLVADSSPASSRIVGDPSPRHSTYSTWPCPVPIVCDSTSIAVVGGVVVSDEVVVAAPVRRVVVRAAGGEQQDCQRCGDDPGCGHVRTSCPPVLGTS